MVERDIVLAKVSSIDRALARIEEARSSLPGQLRPIDVEDIIVLHIQRAAQAAIDLAAHVVSTEGFGLPARIAESFTLLENNGVIDRELAARMRAMTGFRNIAVHQYEILDPNIVAAIVAKHLVDVRAFAQQILIRFGIAE